MASISCMAGLGRYSVATEARGGCTSFLRLPFGSPSLLAVWGLPRDALPRGLLGGVVLPSGMACFLGAFPVVLSVTLRPDDRLSSSEA